MKEKVEVVPYNLKWPELFAEEAKRVQAALGDNCVAIHHIGSTAVPGLAAKPVIDMLPVVKEIMEVDICAMEKFGYESKGEYGIAFRRYFQKGKNLRTHNVHIYEQGNPEIDRYLKFRNWLRSHDEDARQYAKLKMELAEQFPQDILQYCFGKDAFVASIDAKDGYRGARMVQALTDREWAMVKQFRLKYFFKTNVDPYTWTFERKDHIHWVYYSVCDIVGYVHLQLWPGKRAFLRIIVIDEAKRGLGLGSQLLGLCELWLAQQGFEWLMTQSSKAAYPFYLKAGFVKMALNDPNGHKTDTRDIEMGKALSSKSIFG